MKVCTQPSLSNYLNLAVTGCKQSQMVSSAAGLTVLMQYSPTWGLLM